eukprot:Nk52_evm1s442 gene=Nk52_evmTU1s442
MPRSRGTVTYLAMMSHLGGAIVNGVATAASPWVSRQDVFGETASVSFEVVCDPAERVSPNVCLGVSISDLSTPWQFSYCAILTASFASIAVALCVFATCRSNARERFWTKRARGFSLLSCLLNSVAVIVLPGGFGYGPVGGSAYKLPEDVEIGYAYLSFIGGTFLCYMGDLLLNTQSPSVNAIVGNERD